MADEGGSSSEEEEEEEEESAPDMKVHDDDDDDDLAAYSHQSYSRQVGICHYGEGWENDTVTLPSCMNLSSIYR